MRKLMITTTALMLSVLTVPCFALDPPTPCEDTDPEAFRDVGKNVAVIDVGEVVKEKGKNLCSILLDLDNGSRVKFVFTTMRTVGGGVAWKQISLTHVRVDRSRISRLPQAPLTPTLTTSDRKEPDSGDMFIEIKCLDGWWLRGFAPEPHQEALPLGSPPRAVLRTIKFR
jgi:hypothetical protein